MTKWAEIYLNRLDEIAGMQAKYHRISSPESYPSINVVTYLDQKESVAQFGFTIGLSAYEHQDWKLARPELCVSINSTDYKWSLAIGEVADNAKGARSFCYGDIIRFGCPISAESELSAFVVFAPSFISKEDTEIQLPEWKVCLAQMYPIYEDEIPWIEKVGLKKLFSRPGSFFEEPNRKSLAN